MKPSGAHERRLLILWRKIVGLETPSGPPNNPSTVDIPCAATTSAFTVFIAWDDITKCEVIIPVCDRCGQELARWYNGIHADRSAIATELLKHRRDRCCDREPA